MFTLDEVLSKSNQKEAYMMQWKDGYLDMNLLRYQGR